MTEQTAREREAKLLQRCVQVARGLPHDAGVAGGREANVLRVAAMVLQSTFPAESRMLMAEADRYFAEHPEELEPVVNVVRNGDVVNLPRLRDGLTRLLKQR